MPKITKITRVVLSAIGFGIGLGLLHAWLNLGFDPARVLGLKKTEEVTRFRVGFLPVT